MNPLLHDPGATAATMRSLLDLVEADRLRRRALVLDEAHRRAQAVREHARSTALARVRHTFAEQRRVNTEHLAAVQARLATRCRLHEQQRKAELLRLANLQLPAALLARWRAPATRATWVEQVLSAALARLPAGAWHIVHAVDWPAEESARAAARVAAHAGVAPVMRPEPGMNAGLSVGVGGTRVDGSLDGLLADRADFEAALLRELETSVAATAPEDGSRPTPEHS